jgi:hypothetical protein
MNRTQKSKAKEQIKQGSDNYKIKFARLGRVHHTEDS